MTSFLTKIKLIFLPFLILALGFITIYTGLNWLLLIRFKVISLNEDLINFWLPFCLPYLPLYIWLWPRIKLLLLKDKKGNLPFLYLLIASFAIAAPTIFLQEYLLTATGRLTTLQSINEIGEKPLTKYYALKTHVIDKNRFAVYRKTETSGRYNETLIFHIYVACPIIANALIKDSTTNINHATTNKEPLIIVNGIPSTAGFSLKKIVPADIASIDVLKGKAAVAIYGKQAKDGAILITLKQKNSYQPDVIRAPKAWLGTEYKKQISNRLNDSEKERLYKEFDSETLHEFQQQDFDQFIYLDRIGNNSSHKGYLSAIKSLVPSDTNPIILEARNEPFEARNGSKLGWVFKSFAIGTGIWLLMLLFPRLKPAEVKKLQESDNGSELASFYKFLLVIRTNSRFPMAMIVICLNVLVFLAMVVAGLGFLSFDGKDLYQWGADYRPAVGQGQYWRLISNIFLHGGLMHLVMNMYGLIFVAIFLEPLLGKMKFIVAYLLCGIFASATSIWWHPATISIGASGAIFGLYGVFTALLTTNKVSADGKKFFLINNLIFIVINLLIGLTGGIDNAAHIGGLLAGFILGYIFYFFPNEPETTEALLKKKSTMAMQQKQLNNEDQ
ncbi:MAG: rhomboid family intramembrane serine protease [Sphingobacteriaceae bacterium]|nr:MAG: rhomboid family intramembrane serine protease [Sphingobacteriaceae bacterium]